MAWNEPGNRKDPPWGKRPDSPADGGLEAALRNFQRRLEGVLGGGGGAGGGEAPGGEGGGNFAGLAIIALVVLWLATGLFQINASDAGVIQRFGKFTNVRGPGVGYKFPWPIETVTKINISRVNSVEYRSRMLTADVNLVEIRSAIQYLYADPVKVLFQVRDPESTLREISESAIREIVGQANLDQVLGVSRQQITENTRDLIQRTLDAYNSGIRITSVNLTDVQVPDAVIAAQRDANRAIEDRDRFSKEAEAYANDILPKAEGTAQRQIQDAEAYKAQVVALAEGDAARFNSVYAAYAQAPEVTRQRMYIETIEHVMQQSNKVILDAKGGAGNMIYLPLDRLGERGGARGSSQAPQNAVPAGQVVDELPPITIDGRGRGTR
jgi:membrane protease subunit HflK